MEKKTWKDIEFIRLLNNNGFKKVSSTGSHVKFKNNIGNTIVVPIGHDINRMMARRLIKENNLVLK